MPPRRLVSVECRAWRGHLELRGRGSRDPVQRHGALRDARGAVRTGLELDRARHGRTAPAPPSQHAWSCANLPVACSASTAASTALQRSRDLGRRRCPASPAWAPAGPGPARRVILDQPAEDRGELDDEADAPGRGIADLEAADVRADAIVDRPYGFCFHDNPAVSLALAPALTVRGRSRMYIPSVSASSRHDPIHRLHHHIAARPCACPSRWRCRKGCAGRNRQSGAAG